MIFCGARPARRATPVCRLHRAGARARRGAGQEYMGGICGRFWRRFFIYGAYFPFAKNSGRDYISAIVILPA